MLLSTTLLTLTISAPPELPDTRREHVQDVYHGQTVDDPYRWLETDVRESDEVSDWVDAQNDVTFGYLYALPQREPIRTADGRRSAHYEADVLITPDGPDVLTEAMFELPDVVGD